MQLVYIVLISTGAKGFYYPVNEFFIRCSLPLGLFHIERLRKDNLTIC